MRLTVERGRSLQLMPLLPKRGASNALIRIRRLLDDHFLVPALAGAAAHAEQPEQARGDAEGDAQPEDLQHLVAHGGFDVIGFECCVEYPG